MLEARALDTRARQVALKELEALLDATRKSGDSLGARVLTVATGLAISIVSGYGHAALTFSGEGAVNLIGVGMWLAIIMAFNVWFIIWPAQKKILGLVEATAEAKAAAAPRALYASRTNTLLSLPMLYAMVSANLG